MQRAEPPIRGTQTFVGVMTAVWRRPSLAGLEIWWRWVAGLLIVVAAKVAFGGFGVEWSVDTTALRNATVFQPVEAAALFRSVIDSALPHILPALDWLVPFACVVWLGAATLGRTLVLRRLDRSLRARPFTLLILSSLRAALLTLSWAIWIWGLVWSARVAITGPAARGEEPGLVLFCVFAICGTLLLYVLWGILSWPLQLAPLLSMRLDTGALASLGAALRAGPVGGKLLEINLVMHIVKLALIVLAMVFSASPLPFTNVATQGFLTCWWIGVILLYFAMSDYFHVVRAAAYLELWNAYKSPSKT